MKQWAVTVQLILWLLIADICVVISIKDHFDQLTTNGDALLAVATLAQFFAVVTAIKVRTNKQTDGTPKDDVDG